MLKNRFYHGKVRYRNEYFDGLHQSIVSEKLFEKVQEVMAGRRSRRSGSSLHRGDCSHLLSGLLRCFECGTPFWSQNQGSLNETCYKSPNKGLELICKYRGRSFLGRDIDAQIDQLFEGFELREDWIEWVVDHHIKGSDIQSVLRERASIESKLERAKKLYYEGEENWD